MTYSVDLPAYFERIGYAGSREPTLATLNAIARRHVQSIPFENLDILQNRPISIEPAAVEAKLVQARRGGYCFEQNTLLSHVLGALGFEVVALSARGRYQAPPGVQRPRTHVLLRVVLGGESYLVDGGFGGLSPTSALRLALNDEQATPHERRRIVSEGAWNGLSSRSPDALLVHQAYLTDGWRDLFEFTLEPMPEPDREMGNWYTSTSPRSRFREALMVARATDHGRVTLQDLELTQRAHDGTSKTQLLTSRRELLDALAEHFQLRFPADTRFDSPGLARLP